MDIRKCRDWFRLLFVTPFKLIYLYMLIVGIATEQVYFSLFYDYRQNKPVYPVTARVSFIFILINFLSLVLSIYLIEESDILYRIF